LTEPRGRRGTPEHVRAVSALGRDIIERAPIRGGGR
jgi:hypothetical protein